MCQSRETLSVTRVPKWKVSLASDPNGTGDMGQKRCHGDATSQAHFFKIPLSSAALIPLARWVVYL
jgi:hypothetical protein